MFGKILDDIGTFFKGANKYVVNGKEYVEEKLIGEGGFAYVYIVVDTSTNIKYALKKINLTSREALEGFKKETEYWTKINQHPNIVKLIDYEVKESKTALVVMELCEEGTLLQYINSTTQQITEKQITYIINEIAQAIYHMHSQDRPIAHRDLKIENVLKFGKKLKLCDFGSASTQTMDPTYIPF